MLIAIEGPPNIGKTAFAKSLARNIQDVGCSVKIIHFPDEKSVLSTIIQNLIDQHTMFPEETKALLCAAHNAESITTIHEALENHDIVVMDKYTATYTASGMVDGLQMQWLSNINAMLPKPDLVIYLCPDDDGPYMKHQSKDSCIRHFTNCMHSLYNKDTWLIINV